MIAVGRGHNWVWVCPFVLHIVPLSLVCQSSGKGVGAVMVDWLESPGWHNQPLYRDIAFEIVSTYTVRRQSQGQSISTTVEIQSSSNSWDSVEAKEATFPIGVAGAAVHDRWWSLPNSACAGFLQRWPLKWARVDYRQMWVDENNIGHDSTSSCSRCVIKSRGYYWSVPRTADEMCGKPRDDSKTRELIGCINTRLLTVVASPLTTTEQTATTIRPISVPLFTNVFQSPLDLLSEFLKQFCSAVTFLPTG